MLELLQFINWVHDINRESDIFKFEDIQVDFGSAIVDLAGRHNKFEGLESNLYFLIIPVHVVVIRDW